MNMLKEESYSDRALQVKTTSKSVSMLLCNSCYWCATQLDDRDLPRCPACVSTIEAIPLERGEAFSFDVDNIKGVILEFKRQER